MRIMRSETLLMIKGQLGRSQRLMTKQTVTLELLRTILKKKENKERKQTNNDDSDKDNNNEINEKVKQE